MWLELNLSTLDISLKITPKFQRILSTFQHFGSILTKTLNVKKRLGNETKKAVICQAIQNCIRGHVGNDSFSPMLPPWS